MDSINAASIKTGIGFGSGLASSLPNLGAELPFERIEHMYVKH